MAESRKGRAPTGAAFGPSLTFDPEAAGPPAPLLSDSLWDDLSDDAAADLYEWKIALAYSQREFLPVCPDEATSLLITAACNDALSLLDHVARRDGRSAAQMARTLFEHLVNYCDIVQSPVNDAERFSRSRPVGAVGLQAHRWYLELLPPNDRRDEVKLLEAIRKKNEAAAAAAVKAYGASYPKGWAQGSLRDRAASYGFGDGYEGYRLLSGVIHGSSGSLAGVVREIRGSRIHRIGPDLDLALFAFAEGFRTFELFAKELAARLGGAAADEVLQSTSAVLHHYPEVRRLLRRDDAKMWPKQPPPQLVTLAAYYPGGVVRWFVHDVIEQTIVAADPPAQIPDLPPFIERRLQEYRPADFGGRPMTVRFAIPVSRKKGARVLNADSILVPSEHPSRFVNGRRIRAGEARS